MNFREVPWQEKNGIDYPGRLEITYFKTITYISERPLIRNLEIIGESTKNLSEEIRAKHPEVPWKSMAGVRDRLIHHYFGKLRGSGLES